MARTGSVIGCLGFVAVVVSAFLEVLHRPGGTYDPLWVTGAFKILIWVVPSLGVAWWIAGGLGAGVQALGLRPFAGRGIALGLACTLPFGLAWWVLGHRIAGADELAGDVILGPVAEEVLFRGFLFLGLRRLGLRFWSAGLVSALAFGVAHVPSLSYLTDKLWAAGAAGWAHRDLGAAVEFLGVYGPMLMDAAEVTLQIAAAGLLFAWVCDRWRSLWPAIALHMAINFWWIMTFGAEGALEAPLWPLSPWTLASVLAVTSTILLTWHQTRRPAPAVVGSRSGPSWVRT